MDISSVNWADVAFQIFWLILMVSLGLFIYKVVQVKKQNKHFGKNR
ncbi:hypothetical protein ACLZHR_19265 [Priestia aryabhattai]|uniref:Uncharacterized protein n=1 Tax=Priestia megaterium Q3 TaxID=1452722 RepID=A0A806TF04_PRIMG|nr:MULTISPECIES: hypothetical protein [Priestia]AKP76671.1 hypothetical protein AS52_01706 [Priestia megaterium Q3]MED3955893.1 hypothetical protein [Priestia aryabhattai]MED4007063.1 hypothetical protein [Priestia aryabhattai]MED4011712.1 hypothetical protein [Priestia aryabhattai]NGY79975.1 hypothetical protein [Priestia megaterium]